MLPTQEANEAKAGALGPDARGFPLVTEDQHSQARTAFIESLDLASVSALASWFNHGKPCRVVKTDSGSFNVCFFVDFGQDEPKWVVRVPIETALDNPWGKLLSEVATMQYLERNTRIPVPHVRAYGRDVRLTKSRPGTQMFLIADLICGEPLDRNRLSEAGPEHRRNFYSQLIDILAELRRLEFPLIGSLMPNPDGSPFPVLGPTMSMSATTLRLPPLPTFALASRYMRHQFNLISDFFSPPVSDHTIDEIRQELFALHGMERIFHQFIDPQLDEGPFVLHHLDLQSPNIIVDKSLQIQGIIDWEFTGTIPRQVFTPPSWITGHDPVETNEQMHVEFRGVLDEKSATNSLCDQLRREWYGKIDAGRLDIDPTDLAFCVAHVLRRPTDITDIFFDFFAQKLSCKPLEDALSEFFDEHQSLALEAQHRAEHCERYTHYLKENGLYGTEMDQLLAPAKAMKANWGWS